MPPSPQTNASRVFDGMPDFGERVEAELRARPFFRMATAAEIDASFAAYCEGDTAALLDTWRSHAAPIRAELPPLIARAYRGARWGPKLANALCFLAAVRAVLRAGERFRGSLAPEVQRAIREEFPWLERRHEHVPPGFSPHCDFPAATRTFLEAGELDDTRARWQLLVALNEVQQSCYSEHFAALVAVPELRLHAARERELALNYFAHWSPRCTRELWRQTIVVLDSLNAMVFELICRRHPFAFLCFGTFGMLLHRRQWHDFVAGMEAPQRLVAPGAGAAR